MPKCRYAKKYKGIKFPRCGCDECLLIWYKSELDRLCNLNEKLFRKLHNVSLALSGIQFDIEKI